MAETTAAMHEQSIATLKVERDFKRGMAAAFDEGSTSRSNYELTANQLDRRIAELELERAAAAKVAGEGEGRRDGRGARARGQRREVTRAAPSEGQALRRRSDVSQRQKQIAEGSIQAVSGTRAEVADDLAFYRAVFTKLPEGRVREQYAELAAEKAHALAELDLELEALAKVREELEQLEPEVTVLEQQLPLEQELPRVLEHKTAPALNAAAAS